MPVLALSNAIQLEGLGHLSPHACLLMQYAKNTHALMIFFSPENDRHF